LSTSGIAPFRALVASEAGVPASFIEADAELLGVGEVTIEVAYSSLNYKDALATLAAAPVVRRYPLVVGIDLAGTVVASEDPNYLPGDGVLVVGCGLGEDHSGGFSRFARVPGSWCVPIPVDLDANSAMAFGTAGFTAMLCCMALERNGATPEALGELPILVTGAAGGVGSLSIALLAALGYRVIAATGRLDEAEYLEGLGAAQVVGREALEPAGRGPLGPASYGGAIDVVGGPILAEVIRRIAPDGTVAACGLAGGAELTSSVYPFILRGVTLAGVNSVFVAPGLRDAAWARLSALVGLETVATISRIEPLSAVPDLAAEMLAGKVRGRVVVDVTR
jgi:acrylyl-CoA reductase (NADPH)